MVSHSFMLTLAHSPQSSTQEGHLEFHKEISLRFPLRNSTQETIEINFTKNPTQGVVSTKVVVKVVVIVVVKVNKAIVYRLLVILLGVSKKNVHVLCRFELHNETAYAALFN